MNYRRLIRHRFFKAFMLLIAVTLILVIVCGRWALGSYSQNAHLRRELDRARVAATQVTLDNSSLDSLRIFYEQLFGRYSSTHDGDDVGRIYSLGNQAGIGWLTSLVPGTSIQENGLELITYVLSVEGTYESLARFVNLLETSTPFFLVREIRIELKPRDIFGLVSSEMTIERLRKS